MARHSTTLPRFGAAFKILRFILQNTRLIKSSLLDVMKLDFSSSLICFVNLGIKPRPMPGGVQGEVPDLAGPPAPATQGEG